MKNYKQILEAVNKGIKFALDDFDDQEDIQGQTNSRVNHTHGMKEYVDFMKDVIDLGLPSGTCWFKYNFGCNVELLDNNPNASVPEDWFGDYYAWGELKPKYEYTRDNYKFYIGNNWKRFVTKYCNMPSDGNFITDNITLLQPEDDVVYQNFVSPIGIKFNIPTKNQFAELVKNTIKEKLTDFNGVKGLNGLLYTSKINGNSIFFPSTGNYDGASHEGKNLVTLWTANLSIIDNNSHYATYFYGNNNVSFATNTRFCGYPVRPVCKLN